MGKLSMLLPQLEQTRSALVVLSLACKYACQPIRTRARRIFITRRASCDAPNANICAGVKEFVVRNSRPVLKSEIFHTRVKQTQSLFLCTLSLKELFEKAMSFKLQTESDSEAFIFNTEF